MYVKVLIYPYHRFHQIFQAEPQELASHIEVGVLNFLTDTDSLLADVISNFGSVLSYGEGFTLEEEEEEMNGAERPLLNSGRPACPGPSHEPDHANVSRPFYLRSLARAGSQRARNNAAVWKFYNKGSIDPNVKFEDNRFSVRTRSAKNTAIIGKPGYERGKHSWKVRVTHFPDGLSVGICLGRYSRGNLVYTYDSGFTTSRMERDVLVELDCDAGKLSILALDLQQSDVLRFDNPQNCKIHPYFGLPSPGGYDFSKVTILSIDEIEINPIH